MQNNTELIRRLDKLLETINKKETELNNIRKLGIKKAGVSSDYVHNLRSEHLACQREYNLILDQNPTIKLGRSKIIIDTFKDYWIEKEDYQIGDSVEIDIEKRLKIEGFLELNVKIGENSQYEFFSIDGSFLRRDKGTSTFVYLGEGRIPSYLIKKDKTTGEIVREKDSIAAAVFNDWIYWYESGGIMSDRFIHRRSIDGKSYEQLDLLSNNKTAKVIGHSAHCVSEDEVRRIHSNSSRLTIEVYRITKNATYKIIVSETANGLDVKTEFPWEKTRQHVEDQASKSSYLTTNSSKSFCSDNPFYVLDVSPNDKRSVIISKAEEKSFFWEGNTCEEAQAKLLNPSRRLLAELDWFLDVDDKKRNEINQCINENREIDIEDPMSFWRINALLYNFSILQDGESYGFGYMLIDIDDQFSLADTYDLADKINACRKEAGMKLVTEAEVSEALTEKRDSIRTVISERLQELPEQEYISLINTISDNCIADPDYEYGVVISDIIDQYEIKYQSEIDKNSNEILTHIDRIKRLSKEEAFKENLSRLIRRLKKWHRIVKPIFTRAIASGLEHPGIDKITHDTRELTVFLHNEKGWTESAYELAVELRKLFDGSGELSERLEDDENTLREILEDSKASSALLAKLNEFADTADYIIDNVCVDRVDSFVDALVEINREIKGEDLGEDLTYKLRERIFYIARGVILALHNDHHRTTHSVRIATALKLHFKDIASLEKVASDDLAALMSQLAPPRNYNAASSKKSSGTSPLGCLIIGLIVLLLIVIPIGLSTCDSSNDSNSSSDSKPSYNNSSNSNNSSSSSSSSSSGSSSSSSSTTTSATVSLDKQGGSGGTSSVTVKDSSPMPSATQPTKEGYIFDGYYAETGGLGTKYYDANMKSVRSWYSSGPETLYAYWIKDPDNINKKGVTITKDNFENYFTIETEAELVGSNEIVITYSIKPKSSSYAKDNDSSSTIYVELGAEASSLSTYFGELSYDAREKITLSKSNNYTASGKMSFKYYVFGDTVYWIAEVAYCSGSIGN